MIFDDSNSGINICGGYVDGRYFVAENAVTITGIVLSLRSIEVIVMNPDTEQLKTITSGVKAAER